MWKKFMNKIAALLGEKAVYIRDEFFFLYG